MRGRAGCDGVRFRIQWESDFRDFAHSERVNLSISLILAPGSRLSTSRRYSFGLMPCNRQLDIRLYKIADRSPASGCPTNSQFLRPSAQGRIAFFMPRCP